jgi:hypothetical protein
VVLILFVGTLLCNIQFIFLQKFQFLFISVTLLIRKRGGRVVVAILK